MTRSVLYTAFFSLYLIPWIFYVLLPSKFAIYTGAPGTLPRSGLASDMHYR